MTPRTQKITFGAGYGSVYASGWWAVTSGRQGNGVPNDDLVIADEDVLDEKP
jgi:hypothetical protein